MNARAGSIERFARIHPGRVIHTMDHFVLDLKDPISETAAYFTVYSLAYMPEVGHGYCAFLRIRTADGSGDLDLAFAETPQIGSAMQERLRRLVANSDVSRGIGTDLELEPVAANFSRLPGSSSDFGFRVEGAGRSIEATWTNADEPLWIAAPMGSFHHEKDIVGTMISFWDAELAVDGDKVPGRPFQDPWWEARLGRPFSSTHLSLGDTAIDPGGSWWAS